MEMISGRQDRSKFMVQRTKVIFVIARFLPSALSRLDILRVAF